jgi:hypothetical protein
MAGYNPIGSPTRYTAQSPAQAADFWTVEFSKPSIPIPVHLRIYWAWSATGAWQAPDYPRLAFASFPKLYKLYVICQTVPADEHLERRSCTEFLTAFLPELQKALFEGPP